jgi:hypothetical protein
VKQPADVTAVMWREEHLWKFSALQKVHLSKLVYMGCRKIKDSELNVRKIIDLSLPNFIISIIFSLSRDSTECFAFSLEDTGRLQEQVNSRA